MWKKYLMLSAAVLFLASASTVSHATETVSGGELGQETVSGGELGQEPETGTYIPYEGAKYSLTYAVQDGEITVTGIADYESKDDLGELVIPAEINGVAVTKIGEGAFEGCSGFTGSLTIPSSVTEIEKKAFSDCSGFTGNLTISDGVTKIGQLAFFKCSGFTGGLNIPDTVTIIEHGAFYHCSGFTGGLKLSDELVEIGSYAFCGCSGFTGNLTIPNSVKKMGYDKSSVSDFSNTQQGYVFVNCSGFTGDLTIPDSLTAITDGVFGGCSGLTGNLTIPDSVKYIGWGAFNHCSGFTGNLTIPDRVTFIGREAFQGCSGFTGNLTISDRVTYIGDSAFNNCSGLTGNLTIPDSVIYIGDSAFRKCSGLAGDIIIPDNVKEVLNGAFFGCDGICSVEVPAGVEHLGNIFGRGSVQTHEGGIKTVTVLGKQTTIPNGLADIFVRGYSDSVVGKEVSKWNYTFIPIDAPEVTEYKVSTVQELLDAIGAAGEGSYRRIILADGVYSLSDTVKLERLVSVSLEAEHSGKAQILSQDASKPVISVSQCAEVVISGCIVDYESGTEQSDSAEPVQVQGSYDVKVRLYGQYVTTDASGVDMGVSVPMTTEEQKQFASDLAAQEGLAVVEGEEAVVEITVSDARSTLAEQDKQAVDRFAVEEKFEIGQYLDITVSILAGSDSRPVSHTARPVRLVMDIPEKLRQAGRVFSVIRLHEGKAALLSDLDGNPDTITIETDRFSAYTLVYRVNDEDCSHTLAKVDAVPPTCVDDGNIEYYFCDKCGKKFADEAGMTEITDVADRADGHTGEAWNSDGENHWKVCTVCGEEFDKNAHTFTWVTDKAATENETGLKHEECVCGATRSEGTLIDKLASEEDRNEENKGDENKGEENKGDENKDDENKRDDDNEAEEEPDGNGQSKLPTISPDTGEERAERTPALQMALIIAAASVILGAGLWYAKKKR